jgi:hypothetical protein
LTLQEVIDTLGHIWPILVALAAIIFDWAVLWTKVKTFVTKDDVRNEVDKILVGHCPFELPMKNLEIEILALKEWKERHESWGLKMNERNHLLLQEIIINLQMVCKYLKIDYTPGNGNRYGE